MREVAMYKGFMVGDVVQIKSWEEIKALYPHSHDSLDCIKTTCGKIARIRRICVGTGTGEGHLINLETDECKRNPYSIGIDQFLWYVKDLILVNRDSIKCGESDVVFLDADKASIVRSNTTTILEFKEV